MIMKHCRFQCSFTMGPVDNVLQNITLNVQQHFSPSLRIYGFFASDRNTAKWLQI